MAGAAKALEIVREAGQAAAMLQSTRRLLLSHLAEPQSAAALARKLGLPRQRLNYHLRELEREGLAECVEERRTGNCTERLLRATARSFVISPEALGSLGSTPEAAADRFSASYLIAAASRVIRDLAELEPKARAAGKRLATFTVETEIRFASAEARARFGQELAAAVATLAARFHDEHAPGGRAFKVLAAAHPALKGARTKGSKP
jgi:DNA-binding transcriptional ArsR family regulator